MMLDRLQGRCNYHTDSANWLSLHTTTLLPCLARRLIRSNATKAHRLLPRRINEKNQICACFCARSALMFMSHLLPRVQLAPSRFQCARRIECHFVFNSSDYLFFALFLPFERVCCHTVVLIACSETRALFSTCCTSHAYIVTCCFIHTQVSSISGDGFCFAD